MLKASDKFAFALKELRIFGKVHFFFVVCLFGKDLTESVVGLRGRQLSEKKIVLKPVDPALNATPLPSDPSSP